MDLLFALLKTYNIIMSSISLYSSDPDIHKPMDSLSRSKSFIFYKTIEDAMINAKNPVFHLRISEKSLKDIGDNNSYIIVPSDIAEKSKVLDQKEAHSRLLMTKLLKEARFVRQSMGIMPIDCAIGGEMAPLARILWRHIPEAASKMGLQKSKDEGGPVLHHFMKDLEKLSDNMPFMRMDEGSFVKDLHRKSHPSFHVLAHLSRKANIAMEARRVSGEMTF